MLFCQGNVMEMSENLEQTQIWQPWYEIRFTHIVVISKTHQVQYLN